MDGHAAKGDDRTLRRIVALLVALAAIADAVAARSHPVRFLVLCILLRAEAVAREFVARTTGTPPPPPVEEMAAARHGPADAVLLAARLRALAAALAPLLRPDRPCRNVRIGGTLRRLAPRPGSRLITPFDLAPRPHDTS